MGGEKAESEMLSITVLLNFRSRVMFDAILYFYQSRGIFKPPSNIDEDVVNNELEFFKISMEEIFGTVEQIVEEKPVGPVTLKQRVSRRLNQGISPSLTSTRYHRL